MHVCIHVYVCMHAYMHTNDRGFPLKNPVLSTLPSSQTTIRCGTYPTIVSDKSLVAWFKYSVKMNQNTPFNFYKNFLPRRTGLPPFQTLLQLQHCVPSFLDLASIFGYLLIALPYPRLFGEKEQGT